MINKKKAQRIQEKAHKRELREFKKLLSRIEENIKVTAGRNIDSTYITDPLPYCLKRELNKKGFKVKYLPSIGKTKISWEDE